MNYADVEARYRELKDRVAAGWLTEDDFKTQLEELMIQDNQGRWWIIGYETGDWYVFDGKEWVQAEPPAPAPTPPVEVAPEAPPVVIESPAESRLPVSDGPGVGLLAGLRVTPMPAAEEALPPLHQPAPEPVAGRASFLKAFKVPWLPVLIMAVGWGFGTLLNLSLPISTDNYALAWGFNGLVDGLIGGAAVLWACRWPDRTWHRSRAAVLVIGWGVAWALVGVWHANLYAAGRYASESRFGIGALGAFAGGLLSASVLRWAGEPLGRGQMAIVTAGWVGAHLAPSLIVPTPFGTGGLISAIIHNLIFGALGGWIMLTQLVRARRGAGGAPVTAAAPKLVSAPTMVLPAVGRPRWTPVAIIATGWGVGMLILALIGNSDSSMVPMGLALAMILGGAATAFVCRREGVALRWYHVLVLLLISPWLMGLVLRWAERRFRWGQVAILFVAWAVAAGIGFGLAYTTATAGDYFEAKTVLAFTLWGIIAGGLGGWVTVDQLARARRAAERAE